LDLKEAGAQDQATALLARDPAAHVALDNPEGAGRQLIRLREAGAKDQAAALAARAAILAPSTSPTAWPRCWAACGDGAGGSGPPRWPPVCGAGMFKLFREHVGHPDRFRFGRRADGSPAGP
jgi:hypothetical protein